MNENSRTENSARNLAMSFIQKIVSIALIFISRQIFLQVLTVEYLGINGLFANILSMLSLADLGLFTAMSFSFYKPLSDRDEDKLAALVGFYRKIYIYIAAFIAATGLALTPFLKFIINLENDIPYIEIYYLIALANAVVSYLFIYRAIIITADQNGSIVNNYAMWTSILKLLIQIAVLLVWGSFMAFCLVSFFTTLLNNILISKKAGAMYPFVKKRAALDTTDKKSIFANIRSMFIYKIASVVFTGTDNIFISVLIGTAVVGKYENYSLAVTNMNGIAFMAFATLTPSIGNLIAREPPEKRMRIFDIMQTVSYWLGGFFVFCLFFLLDDFVVLWLGTGFTFDIYIKIAVLIQFYLNITLYPVFAFREATGIYQKTKYVMVAAALIKIVLSILFGLKWGLAGILLAPTVAKLVTYAWYEPKVLFRDYLSGRLLKYFLGHVKNLCLFSACITAVYFIYPRQLNGGWPVWISMGAVCTLLINAVYYVKYRKTPEFQVVLNKTSGIIKQTFKTPK